MKRAAGSAKYSDDTNIAAPAAIMSGPNLLSGRRHQAIAPPTV
ncbi:MAG TPA: hypothetical protein VK904_07520 [Miltoncostaeaceae bacterium]|nr:hypothetical protein [Miltoncostaeaceae bacterium]